MKARYLFLTAVSLMLGLGALIPPPAPAAYPDHSIQLIIPYVPGATGDITARLLADELEKILGQKIVPNNKAGAGTVLGAATAQKLIDTLLAIETVKDIRALRPLLQKS